MEFAINLDALIYGFKTGFALAVAVGAAGWFIRMCYRTFTIISGG